MKVVRSQVSTHKIAQKKTTVIKPRNEKQQRYVELLELKKPCIVVGYGSAGSGKTRLAIDVGVNKLANKEVNRLVFTRPAVAVDEEHHGFLPGTLSEKMRPWIMPMYDALSVHFNKNEIETMICNQVLEIAPLAFMRGRTFEKSWIICDEAQNMTSSQMLMMLTRIGKDSKLVITGDPLQHDRMSASGDGGLMHFIKLLRDVEESNSDIQLLEFDQDDVERHHVIPFILNLYTQHSKL